MFGRALGIRPSERGAVFAAFAFLTALLSSHALLETARDALFLARLPASELPFMYLSVAALSLLLARLEARIARAVPLRSALIVWTFFAALGTLGAYLALRSNGGRFGLYALYAWSGIIAAVSLLHFWSLLGEAFSVTQAKRLYPVIGAGGVAGALLGSAVASGLARMVPADNLLLAAAFGFGSSAAAAALLPRSAALPQPLNEPGEARAPEPALRAFTHPYVRRVGLLVLLSAACLTCVDYAFKSAAAAHVAPAELGAFFGTAALAFNALSLICQLALAPFVLRRFDLAVALSVLPALLVVGGVGLLAGLPLYAALFVKGSDGALRYSLHRTATELLFVALPDRARPRIKAALDLAAQRAGQALASLLLVALAAFALPQAALPLLLIALACAWLAVALDLRRHYVALLRHGLPAWDAVRAGSWPELDLASYETLIAALDSTNESEVLAALDVLEREQRSQLVPALILHHPSELVVERALLLFARARRTNVVHLVDRLLEHGTPTIRCAAVAARSLIAPDAKLLYARLSAEESPEVRATIAVHLIAASEIVGVEADERLAALTDRGSVSTRIALAGALALRDDPRFVAVLSVLAAAPEAEVRVAALDAIAQLRTPALLPTVLQALGDERTRGSARAALQRFGEAGFDAAAAALRDAALPARVRYELPRALALFAPRAAVDALLERLLREEDGLLRYRILRALEDLVARNPEAAPARARLDAAIAETVARAFRYLDERLVLEQGAQGDPRRATPGHALLVQLLRDKEHNARDRLFRLLAMAHPSAEFARIARSLREAQNEKARARSVELASSFLRQPLRAAVIALIDELPDGERLGGAGPFHKRVRRGYDELLEHMLGSESEALQDLVAYHAGELGLSRLRPALAAIAEQRPGHGDLSRALQRLEPAGAVAEGA